MMVKGIPASLEAIHALAERFNRTAKNVANVNTDGYKADRVVLQEGPAGGVRAVVETDNTPGPVRLEQAESGFEPVEMSNVDLAREMTTMMVDQRHYEANLKVIKSEDERLGTTLDILA
jgi:flagellar basal-body rod protein FlgC